MIYTLKEELFIILYLFLFGIYLSSIIDFVDLLLLKIKKIVYKTIISIGFILIQIYIIYIFSYNIMDGYVPIYFGLFILSGYYIYYKFFKKAFIKNLEYIFKIVKYILNKLSFLLYSKTFFNYINKFFKREYTIIKKSFTKKQKKKK